jgi:excinuclease UvrABC nuclease subunit
MSQPPSQLRAFGASRAHNSFEGKNNTRRRRALKEIARTLPRTPGVYFFYGLDDRLLYIGKAKCLRERVRSYFAETKQQRPPKLRRLLAEIERLDFHQCGSELEALLLERRLIAQRRPILNHQLKRFEVYPYLLLSNETFPRLTVTRAEPINSFEFRVSGSELEETEEIENNVPHTELETRNSELGTELLASAPHAGEIPGLYLGPFTTPRQAHWTFEAVRNFFPLRSCEGDIVPDEQSSGCIYFEIGRCCGPCRSPSSHEEYSALVDDLLRLLHEGESPQLARLRAKMEKLAEAWRFEEAGKLKLQLESIEHVAARLRRLEKIRRMNNVAIVQCAHYMAGDAPRCNVFLVHGGVVRRHVVVQDWESESSSLRDSLREVFNRTLDVKPFTAKEELDEMLILDRWLHAHGNELCCAWLNERSSHAWAGNAVRRLRAWARRHATLSN